MTDFADFKMSNVKCLEGQGQLQILSLLLSVLVPLLSVLLLLLEIVLWIVLGNINTHSVGLSKVMSSKE